MAIISICRGTQSGGQALAECLAEELQYPLVAREVLQDAASELGISEQELSRAMERAPRLWKRHASVRRAYIATIQAALAEHTVGGDLVYHGRAGQMLLAGLPAVLRVRLIAPMGARVSTLLERNEMTPTSAEEYIQHVDAARARWVKMMYGEDIEDPALYDLSVAILDHYGIEKPSQMIGDDCLGETVDRGQVRASTAPLSLSLKIWVIVTSFLIIATLAYPIVLLGVMPPRVAKRIQEIQQGR